MTPGVRIGTQMIARSGRLSHNRTHTDANGPLSVRMRTEMRRAARAMPSGVSFEYSNGRDSSDMRPEPRDGHPFHRGGCGLVARSGALTRDIAAKVPRYDEAGQPEG